MEDMYTKWLDTHAMLALQLYRHNSADPVKGGRYYAIMEALTRAKEMYLSLSEKDNSTDNMPKF